MSGATERIVEKIKYYVDNIFVKKKNPSLM
jgi:hypothetical protein